MDCDEGKQGKRWFKELGLITNQNGGARQLVFVPRQPACNRTAVLPLAASATWRAGQHVHDEEVAPIPVLVKQGRGIGSATRCKAAKV